MPDLDTELEHLADANRHISEAQIRITELDQRIRAEGLSSSKEQAVALLETMRSTLDAFEEHRALILEAIADIKSERGQ
jgi:hypothetical protein